ncbi:MULTISPECIES: hypothetical protein [unclassified Symbiopectobacterium]|nr:MULTISPECIES: hypothetical protein [unclassified Symbiopectobacterium]
MASSTLSGMDKADWAIGDGGSSEWATSTINAKALLTGRRL